MSNNSKLYDSEMNTVYLEACRQMNKCLYTPMGTAAAVDSQPEQEKKQQQALAEGTQALVEGTLAHCLQSNQLALP